MKNHYAHVVGRLAQQDNALERPAPVPRERRLAVHFAPDVALVTTWARHVSALVLGGVELRVQPIIVARVPGHGGGIIAYPLPVLDEYKRRVVVGQLVQFPRHRNVEVEVQHTPLETPRSEQVDFSPPPTKRRLRNAHEVERLAHVLLNVSVEAVNVVLGVNRAGRQDAGDS